MNAKEEIKLEQAMEEKDNKPSVKKPKKPILTSIDKLILEDQNLPSDLSVEDLELLFEEEQIDITSPVLQQKINRRLLGVEERRKAALNESRERPEGFLEHKKEFLDNRDRIAMSFNRNIVNRGMVVGIIALFLTESMAVWLGVNTFLADHWFAGGVTAATLVLLYFSIEWRLASVLKMSQSDTDYKPIVVQVKRTRNIMVLLIIVLGVLGRIGPQLQTLQGMWLEGLFELFLFSTLYRLIEYIGVGFLSYGLLRATHWLISYMQEITFNVVGPEEMSFFDPSPFEREREQVVKRLLRYELQRLMAKKTEQTLTNWEEYQIQVRDWKKNQQEVPLLETTNSKETSNPQLMPPSDDSSTSIVSTEQMSESLVLNLYKNPQEKVDIESSTTQDNPEEPVIIAQQPPLPPLS